MLIELMIIVITLGMFSSICLPAHTFSQEAFYEFSDAYLLAQSQAIVSAENTYFQDDDGRMISFNEDGNVSHAQTIHFSNTDKVIIVELGGGRLVIR